MTKTLPLLWSGPALQDLRDAVAWIRTDDPIAARATAARIRQALERLPRFPLCGRVVPELAEAGYREIVVAPFRIVYEANETRIVVLRLWHGRRDLVDGAVGGADLPRLNERRAPK
jgi:plasmid stabilization system protein ParE